MARLPQPGGDAGNWGEILNEYLSQVHNTDGTLKPSIIQSSNLATDAVSTNALANNSVTTSVLAVSGGTDGQVLTKDSLQPGGLAWQSVSVTGGVSSVNTRTGAVTLTASDVGLANVNNTADTDKPVSSAVQTELNKKIDTTDKGVANGVATLDSSGKVTSSQLPVTSQVNSDWDATSGVAQILNKPTIPAQLNAAAGANMTITGTYPNLTFAATSSSTDLSFASTATDATITSSTGIDATMTGASATNAGVMVAADKTKLDGVAAGATANATDTQLRDRATHTGTQAIATVTGLQTALDLKFDSANVDTDVNLTADSDTKVASQKAIRAYVAGKYLPLKNGIASLTDSTNDTFARVNITNDGSSSSGWPDRFAFYYDGVRTGYHNEYGELRARPAKQNTVAFRAMPFSPASTGNFFEVAPNDFGAPRYLGVSQSQIEMSLPVNSTADITTTGNVHGANITTLQNSIGAKVLLIDNAAALPAGTPAGVVVVVKV